MSRLVSPSMLCGLLALVAAAAPLSAQEPRVVVVGSGVTTAHNGSLPISDLAVSDIVARNFPDVLHGDQSYHLSLVVDANGTYVSGKATKATIITRTNAENAGVIFADSALAGAIGAAKVVVRKTQDGDLPIATGGGVMIARSGAGEGTAAIGVLGTGYKLTDVSTLSMKRYGAGELGDATIMVTVVQLKN